MTGPDSSKSGTGKPVKVKTVVKEYLDILLADVFPDIVSEFDESLEQDLQPPLPKDTTSTFEEIPSPEVQAPVKVKQEAIANEELKEELKEADTSIKQPSIAPPLELPVVDEPAVEDAPLAINEPEPETELQYPQAPPWAQAGFDILLFNVCGLKLAVSMEALGRIIKVEHETTQIIGKPDWFIGAYHESDQHLYVVDTAKFIMPEKGFDLAKLGFDYIIQLQRSDWTLACKEVYKTIRITPDQVKWRSQKGKRQWLAGTVIEHMCALIHVDSLIDLLKEQAS